MSRVGECRRCQPVDYTCALGPLPKCPSLMMRSNTRMKAEPQYSATASATTAITTRMYIERYGYGNAVHEDAGRESS